MKMSSTTRTTFAAALMLLLAGGCKDKSTPAGATDAMSKMAGFRDRMCACKDATCAKKVSDEMVDWSKKQPSEKPAAMTPEQQTKANAIGTELGECMMKATASAATDLGSAGSAGSAGGAPAAGSAVEVGSAAAGSADAPRGKNAAGLPMECDDYKAAVDKLATCEKMSKQARETLVKGYADAAAGWAALPEASKTSLATSCKGGTEAVLAVAKTQCGW